MGHLLARKPESQVMNDERLLHLHPDDNVLVLTCRINAGENFLVDGQSCRADRSLNIGHKIARRDIRAGEKVLKYGASIGSATLDIRRGDHVHLHNLKSDYLPTHTFNEG